MNMAGQYQKTCCKPSGLVVHKAGLPAHQTDGALQGSMDLTWVCELCSASSPYSKVTLYWC
jgi:hypothetical protein